MPRSCCLVRPEGSSSGKRRRYIARATSSRVRRLAHAVACASTSAEERVNARPPA